MQTISIKDLLIKEIKGNETGVVLEDIISKIDFQEYGFKSENQFLGTVLSDLMIDGRFFLIDGKWDLKAKYQSNIIRKHRSIKSLEKIEELPIDVIEEKEITNTQEVATSDSLEQFLGDQFLDEDE